MDAAEHLIYDYGFSGTTVDAILERAGVTKGAFFHHFPTKADLGHALVERYAALDAAHLEEALEQAEGRSRDPLQQVLTCVRIFEEQMQTLTEPYPGCLFASYCYQAELFDPKTLAVARRAMVRWRDRLGAKLREAAEQHPPRYPVDPESLADMMLVTFEGAFILSRSMEEPKLVARQLAHYRAYLALLFGLAS